MADPGLSDAANDFDRAMTLLRENGVEPDGPGASSPAEIAVLEARLGVRLPPSYNAMVEGFGCLEFEAVEIYGLVKTGRDAKGIPNVVFATESDRATRNNGFRDGHHLKREYQLDSEYDIFVDRRGNMYSGPRKGTGTPQWLNMNKD